MDRLIQEMLEGNPRAVENLLEQHRSKLKKMVSARIDRRLAARVDASDIVQDALADAARMLTDEIQRRQAVPFYPWLRAIALNRLTDNYRKNIVSRRRSVLREEGIDSQLNDQSAVRLAAQLISPDTSPSGRFNRKERSQRVREALQSLPAEQREVVVLKYLEELSTDEMAVILNISDRTVRRRHRLAIQQLGELLQTGTVSDD